MILAIIALVLSVLCLGALCVGDPKRLRSSGRTTAGLAPFKRRVLTAASLVPGLILALAGDAAAFFIWLGGCAAGGWLLAQYFCRSTSRQATAGEKRNP